MKMFLIKSLLVFLLTTVGLLCSLVAYSSYKNVIQLKTWTKMTVTVFSVAVSEEHRSKGTTYCPHINVGFEMMGQPLTSKLQITQEPCNPLKHVAVRTAEAYGVGKTLEVFVNPLKPTEVRLATYSLGWVFYMTVIVGALSFVGVIVVLFSRLRATDRARPLARYASSETRR